MPDEIVTIIDLMPSPSARSTAEPIIPMAIIGNEGTEINRKVEAVSSVLPVAPIDAKISLLKISKKITAIDNNTNVNSAKTVVCFLASSQFSAPNDLETKAVVAIMNAIPTEIVKN